MIHAIFHNKDYYALFDTNRGTIEKEIPLISRPADFHCFGDEFWISYPDLSCIMVHDKTSLEVKETLYFDHCISSFDVYKNYIFYTEDDQASNAYRYDLLSGKEETIKPPSDNSFYEADVLVNEKEELVYIGESNRYSSTIFCYDADRLTLRSDYESTGRANSKRISFLCDNKVYWFDYELDCNLFSNSSNWDGSGSYTVLHVDESFVVTTRGIYFRDTGEEIVRLYDYPNLDAFCITESVNFWIIQHDQLTMDVLI